jgi:uncharacterized membrane protein YphA (DoxX/SURF4 family)
MDLSRYARYAPALVRYALALVFLTFGIMQLVDAGSWLGYVPSFVPIDARTAVYLNGVADAVFGILLALGVWTRIVALLAALHLLGITLSLGFNEIAVRDFGLSLALISVVLHGPDALCLGNHHSTT